MAAKATAKKVRNEVSDKLDLSKATVRRVAAPPKPHRMTMREIRLGTGKTQEEIAELLGITQSVLSRLERAEDMNLSTLERYAVALGARAESVSAFRKGHWVVLGRGT